MKIYHYTSLETLAKILQTKTIRFNRLDCVDDLAECGVSQYAKYVFVSCWTESAEENIALWKMYTSDISQGVRISLPKDMFKTYPILKDPHLNTKLKYSLIPSEIEKNANYQVLPVDLATDNINEIFYRHIEYVRNPRLAVGAIRHQDFGKYGLGITLDVNRLGRFKEKCWEFQQEVRFALTIFPFNPLKLVYRKDARDIITSSLEQKLDLPFSEYYLHLKDDIFEQLEITLSPNISVESKQRVNALVNDYAPNALIRNSSFCGRINLK